MNCTRKFRCDGVMYMIKVLLADDQELIRESLGFVLGCRGVNTVQQSSYGRIDVSKVPICTAYRTISDLSKPISGRKTGREIGSSVTRSASIVWLAT